jgi:hypothetical protein
VAQSEVTKPEEVRGAETGGAILPRSPDPSSRTNGLRATGLAFLISAPNLAALSSRRRRQLETAGDDPLAPAGPDHCGHGAAAPLGICDLAGLRVRRGWQHEGGATGAVVSLSSPKAPQ